MEEQPKECEPESMDSEDDLFVMFTSGVAEDPKGIVHSQAGYLLHVAVTFKVCTCATALFIFV
jgi:acetyl-CoA synthetase